MVGESVINMRLKELRIQKGLTQTESAKYLGISLRTYQNYENDEQKSGSYKYTYMLEKLSSFGFVDEENGLLTIDVIKAVCNDVLSNYDVSYCYLFGSYAKGKANEKSDVDLLINTTASGLSFYELVESLRESLKKKVDILNQSQLKDNLDLVNEILKDGIKIYG